MGWYPEFDENGEFIIQIIKDYDWETPICLKKCKDVPTLIKYTEQAIEILIV